MRNLGSKNKASGSLRKLKDHFTVITELPKRRELGASMWAAEAGRFLGV